MTEGKREESGSKGNKYDAGLGIATGTALGVAFGVIFGNLGLGLAIGLSIGAACDFAFRGRK